MTEKPTTLTELRIRLDNEEYSRIMGWLLNGGGIGEEVELIVDTHKFSLGKFKAKITEFTPKKH